MLTGSSATPISIKIHRIATKAVCILNIAYLSAVSLISLASVFFYRQFALWMGEPFNAILRLPEVAVRGMMLAGFLLYGIPAFGSILLLQGKPKGFWIYAIPGFVIITASLFIVFNGINLFQLVLLSGSIVYLSGRLRTFKTNRIE